MTTIMTIPIGKSDEATLHVDVRNGDDPHIYIHREGAGLVRVEPHEVRHLAEVLTLAGGDLAALAALGKGKGDE